MEVEAHKVWPWASYRRASAGAEPATCGLYYHRPQKKAAVNRPRMARGAMAAPPTLATAGPRAAPATTREVRSSSLMPAMRAPLPARACEAPIVHSALHKLKPAPAPTFLQCTLHTN